MGSNEVVYTDGVLIMLLKKCLGMILIISTIMLSSCAANSITPANRSQSTKGPSVWTSLGGPKGTQVESLVISPSYFKDHLIYAVTTGGLYHSTNGGTTWQYALNGIAPQNVNTLVFSPNFEKDKTLFAGTANGVLRSIDGGKSWVWCNSGLIMPNSGFYGISLAVSPAYATDKTLFLSTIETVFRSNNGGDSWSQVHTFQLGVGFDQIYCSPNFAKDKTLFIQGVGVYYSTDEGNSWEESSLNQYTRALAFSDNFVNDHTMLAASDNSLTMSTDSGNTWNKLNLGSDTAVGSVEISPQYSKDHTLFTIGGDTTEDNILRSSDNGNSWQTIYTAETPSSDATSLVISPSFETDHTVFAGFYCGGISKSTNNGDTWQDISSGLPLSEMSPIAVSPDYTNDHTLFGFSASEGLFRSLDSGQSWQNIKSNGGRDGADCIVRISPTYAVDHILFVVDGAEIARSSDGGNTWQALNSGLPSGIVALSLSPDFEHDHTLYVGIENSGVYRSTDGGTSWQLLDTQLQPYFVNIAISPDFATDSTIIISTGTLASDTSQGTGAILKSMDRGDSWKDISGNVTNADTNVYGVNIEFSPAYAQDHTVIANANKEVFISKDGGTSWAETETGFQQGFTTVGFTPVVISPNFENDKTLFTTTWDGLLYSSTDSGNSWQQISNLPDAWIENVIFSPTFNTDHTIFVGSCSGVFKEVFTAAQISR
jgi:photosystem II stability/assembly factor-like uncharacterized protein